MPVPVAPAAVAPASVAWAAVASVAPAAAATGALAEVAAAAVALVDARPSADLSFNQNTPRLRSRVLAGGSNWSSSDPPVTSPTVGFTAVAPSNRTSNAESAGMAAAECRFPT